MRQIPFSELDDLLKYFDSGYQISHDEAYRRFAEIRLMPPADLPEDPFSPDYSEKFMELYKKLSQRSEYSVQNERSDFDVAEFTLRPYPYFTKSLKRTAQHYELMAKLFDMMDVPPGGRILECGFGWGNTTLALCKLGYEVTALDIEDRFCDLVERRAQMRQISNLKVVNSDFLWVEKTEEKFDAVVYFESFHHCWEFDRLLKALHQVLKPGGTIYFGAEPIDDGFPTPWGIRLDGESLFVARRSGWMELGFQCDFFQELLRRNGWWGTQISTHFWRATRRAEPIVILAGDARLKSQFGQLAGQRLKISPETSHGHRHFGVYGPYIDLLPGTYDFSLSLTTEDHGEGGVTFDICSGMGGTTLHTEQVDDAALRSGRVTARISSDEALRHVECRLTVPSAFRGAIEAMTITEIY